MPRPTPFRIAAAAAAIVLAAGCKATGGKDAAAGDAAADTAGSAATGGMTEAQLQEQAKSVSPDQARQMGIPDSTVMPGSENEVSDSTSSPAAGRGDRAPDSAATVAVPAQPAARRDKPKP